MFDKCRMTKKTLGYLCVAALTGSMLIAHQEVAQVYAQESAVVKSYHEHSGPDIVSEIREGKRGQIYAGYYRTWHDVTATSEDNKSLEGKNVMSEVPKEVDVLFVFDSYVGKNSEFWNTLKQKYVPALHQKGTAVVQTLGVKFLTGEAGISTDAKYTNDDAGYQLLAKDIVDTYVTKRGLDGLDIDVEQQDYNLQEHPDKAERALKVFQEIANLIGKTGKDPDKLLIMDTTLAPSKNELFTKTAPSLDLVLRQYYGSQHDLNGDTQNEFAKIDREWEEFRQHIHPRQFLIGFSFFEENAKTGNVWYDVATDDHDPNAGKKIEGTRAERYAKWQPKTGGLKGGIFSYAIERDGIAHPTKDYFWHRGEWRWKSDGSHPSNDKSKTDYTVSKELKKVLKENKEYVELTEADIKDKALREAVIKQVSPYKGDLEKFDGTLVLEDSNIQSLDGLKKLKNVRHLVLKDLPRITEITPAMLPESMKRQQGQEEAVLEIVNLTNLTKLDLSNLNRETLDKIDIDSLSQLKTVDLSGNGFDFSEYTAEYSVLQKILAKVPTANVGGQRPEGYLLDNFGEAKVTLPTESTKIDLKQRFLTGAKTRRGTVIRTAAAFQEVVNKGANHQAYIAEDYHFEDFTQYCHYDDYTVEFRDYKHVQIKEHFLDLSQPNVYTVMFRKPNGQLVSFSNGSQEVTALELTVGEGVTALENLAANAETLYKETSNDGATLFDGNLDSHYKEYAGNSLVFRLKTPGVAKYWNLYRSGYSGSNSSDDVVKAKLYVLINESSLRERTEYQERQDFFRNGEAHWEEVASFNNDGTDIISQELKNVEGSIFKVVFEKVRGNYAVVDSVEMQILGEIGVVSDQNQVEEANQAIPEEQESEVQLDNLQEDETHSESEMVDSEVDNPSEPTFSESFWNFIERLKNYSIY